LSSGSSCKVKCPSYALRCNTYKSVGGTVLIPGPQGPSSGSLANFSGINSTGATSTMVTYSSYGSQINITDSSGTLTFNLAGKYLFQYNVNIVSSSGNIQLTRNGTATFGSQTVASAGNYGCSVIQDLNAGDTVSLGFIGSLDWSFASLSVIKL
jgi:hypothetical protein